MNDFNFIYRVELNSNVYYFTSFASMARALNQGYSFYEPLKDLFGTLNGILRLLNGVTLFSNNIEVKVYLCFIDNNLSLEDYKSIRCNGKCE